MHKTFDYSNIPYVIQDGKKWYEFSLEYESDDHKYSTQIWAISFEHAQLVLQDIKDNGKISGVIV